MQVLHYSDAVYPFGYGLSSTYLVKNLLKTINTLLHILCIRFEWEKSPKIQVLRGGSKRGVHQDSKVYEAGDWEHAKGIL